MDYIDIKLPMTEISPSQDAYPERAYHDIVPAVYHAQYPEKDNPDIAALPPRIPDGRLSRACACGYPGYSRDAVSKMKLSERLIALDALKDYVRVFLPYYQEFSRRLLSCLLSAYRGRDFAVGKDHFRSKKDTEMDPYTRDNIGEDQVLSVSPAITTNVQDMALVGVAGTGKSTCLHFNLSFFPHGMYHTLPGGYKCLQIPFLQISAVNINDTKAFFITLAAQIDRYIGHGNVYKSLMTRKNNISKMLEYFDELAAQFHVGMIIIDEVQMITDKSIFQHLLSLSNSSHISLCLIGTEEAMAFLHKNTWAKRRFGELGLIKAEFGTLERAVMESALRQMWKYQFTYGYTTDDIPDEESVALLCDASMGNIDLLSTLFVKAQRIALMEDRTKTTCLTPEIIRKAVTSVQEARKLIRSEKKVIETYVPKEKAALREQMREDIATEKAREARAAQDVAEKEFLDKTSALDDLIFRISQVADYSPKKIEAAYDRLVESESDIDLKTIEPKQRAKLVLAALQEKDIKKQKKKKEKGRAESESRNEKKKSVPAVFGAGLEDVLTGGIDDITSVSANVS